MNDPLADAFARRLANARERSAYSLKDPKHRIELILEAVQAGNLQDLISDVAALVVCVERSNNAAETEVAHA